MTSEAAGLDLKDTFFFYLCFIPKIVEKSQETRYSAE